MILLNQLISAVLQILLFSREVFCTAGQFMQLSI